MVYFARLANGLIKIGTTGRMKQHNKAGAFIVLGVHDGGPDVERAVHQRFDHLRVEGNGSIRRPEHFRPDPGLLTYIAENCREPDLLDQLDGFPAIAVTLRGSPEWKKWIEAGARYCRTDVAKLIDAAVVDYLKARGFSQEAPER
jgi:hypothetical protein